MSPGMRRSRGIAAGIGAAGALVGLGAAVAGSTQVFRAYLVAYLFWLGVALGSLALLMLYHLVGGVWGYVLRRLLESAALTLPLMAVLFLPLLFGLHHLYPWTNPAGSGAQPLPNRAYLNVPFFLVRAAVYFGVWTLLAVLFARWSLEQDRTGGRDVAVKMQRLAGPGLVLYAVTMTFGGWDWIMSLQPAWWSSIFGMILIVGQALSALGVMVILARLFTAGGPFEDLGRPSTFHDFGNLMLMLVMLWAYLSFSQFLIIWAGNLTDEIVWYMPRYKTSWVWVSGALLLFYFFVPFVLLLFRRTKRHMKVLAVLAAGILVMRWVELVWTVEPSFDPSGIAFHWLDLVLPIGMGGIWFAVFAGLLARAPLLARHDARMEGAESHA
jgi:hypothetical protein